MPVPAEWIDHGAKNITQIIQIQKMATGGGIDCRHQNQGIEVLRNRNVPSIFFTGICLLGVSN